MIKDQMTLALSVDTAYLKTTVDAMNESDETLAAYAVGFIPWELVQESTLFSWTRYNVKYTYNVASSIAPAENPYSDSTQLSATKGIPFMYAVSPTAASPQQYRALYKNPETGLFESAGNAYKSGTTYNTTNTEIKNILHSVDLSDIVTNNRNAPPTMVAQFTSVAILYDNDSYDFSAAWINRTAPIAYDPVSDTVADFTFSYNVAGVQFSRTITDADFKTWGKMGYSGTIETGGHKYAIFDYCTGIYCVNALPVNGNTGAYVNGFIAANFPYRYTSTIGLHDSFNFPSSGGFSGFVQGYNSFYNATGVYTNYSSSPIDADAFVNTDSVPSISVTMNNDDREDIAETYYRYKTAMAFSVLMKSYTALDLKIMALISTPIVKINNSYYCPEFNEDYSLTGRWIPYTNQTLNPDDNSFNPADIPEPEPGDDTADSGGDNILPYDFVNTPLSAANNFTTLYALTTDQVSKFGTIMWASLSDENFWHAVGVTFTNDFSINPADMMRYFVFLRYYPFDLSGVSASYTYGIYIGRSTYPIQFPTGTAFPRRVLRNLYQLDGGEVIATLPAPYNTDDFYTMDPCTQVQAHIPYCGRVQLPASEVYGKKLKLQYVIDLQTGAIQAILSVVSNSQYIIATLAGTCGASVQITANNNIEFLTRIATVATGGISEAGTMATQGAKIAGEEGAAAGAVLGALTGTVSALAGLPPVTVHSQGNTTGFANFGGDKQAYITIVTVKRSIPKSFAKSCGYVSNKQAKIGDLQGYTEMINPDLSGISAHEDELNEIYNILQSGFYA